MASNQQHQERGLDPHQLEAAASYVSQFLADHHQQPVHQHQQHPHQMAPAQPQHQSQQQPLAQQPHQHPMLNQYLGGGPQAQAGLVRPMSQPPQPQAQAGPVSAASLAQLVADYLSKASVAAGGPVQALPPGLLATLQAASQHQPQPQQHAPAPAPRQAPPPPVAVPPPLPQQQGPGGPLVSQGAPQFAQPQVGLSHSAAQQQLLASAQLLSTVNPGLAAAAMAQALTMGNNNHAGPVNNGVYHPHPTPSPHAAAPGAAHNPFPSQQQQSLLSQQQQQQHPTLAGQHPHQQQPSLSSPQPPLAPPVGVAMPQHGHPHNAVVQQAAPQAQAPLPHSQLAHPPISAGAAAAQAVQYRQVQVKQPVHLQARPASVGTIPVHSNRSSPGMPVMAHHHPQQQARPSSAMASLAKQPAVVTVKPPMLHQVSTSSSLNTLNNNSGIANPVIINHQNRRPSLPLTLPLPPSTQAIMKVGRNPSPPKKKMTPRVQVQCSQPSVTSSSQPSIPSNLSSGVASSNTTVGVSVGVSLPKMNVAAASAIHHHRGQHHNGTAAAMAASAVTSNGVPPVTPSVPPPGLISHVPITTMQKWKIEQLDTHVQRLRDANQPVPQAVALLAADTRRKEEKRQAKRLANRKSACTSRARKKALIEEMTKDNARLRRQALILSYLPDPVVAISTDGVITFCSMQVERVLRHDVEGLVGANIEDIIVPSSRENIRRLIRDLIIAEQRALSSSVDAEEGEENSRSHQNAEGGSESSVRENNVAPHEVSDQSVQSFPPLLEVKVKAGQTSTEVAAGEDVSDSSGDRLPSSKDGKAKTPSDGMSSLTREKNSSFGHTESNSNSSEGDQGGQPRPTKKVKVCAANKLATTGTGSDDSTSSANKANANLTKNVEMCKLNKDKKEGSEQVRFLHKDDVMGASVTANNADAKLSSLMHHPSEKEDVDAEGNSSSAKQPAGEEQVVASIRCNHVSKPKLPSSGKQEEQSTSSSSLSQKNKKKRSGNSSEDSGYRESNESPEEEDMGSRSLGDSSSSMSGGSSERSSSKSKKKRRRTRPLAPACNVRLIRHDLSTIWCELTSSIRTRPPNDTDNELNIVPPSHLKQPNPKNGSNGNNMGSNESVVSSTESVPEEKELLLCFRPIREGEKVGEELRFQSNASDEGEHKAEAGSDGCGSPTAAASSEDGPKVSSGNSSCSNKDAANYNKRKTPALNSESNSSSADTPTLTETLAVPQAPTAAALAVSSPMMKKQKNRPPKKRRFEEELSEQDTQVDEKSAVESMMELANR